MKRFFIPIIIALLTIPLAIRLAPWFNAATTPVQVLMDAPVTMQARVSWGETGSLPLVPVTNPDGKTASRWLAELPARPQYHLSLSFDPPYRRMVFRGIRLMDERQVDHAIYERVCEGSEQWFTTENLRARYAGDSFALMPGEEARLVLPELISVLPRDLSVATLKVWASLTFLFVSAFLLVAPLGARPHPLPGGEGTRGTLALWIAFAVATIAHLVLLLHSPVVLAGGDSSIYLLKGISLARHGTYNLGGTEYEINRLPGYPLIICLLVKTIGYHLTRIAVVQSLLFCGSVLALAMASRKWIYPWVGAIAIVVATLSPAQVWGCRTILSESTFGSFCNFAIAALLMHVQTSGRRSTRWLMIYGAVSAYAVFIRPNGIALYAALIPVYLPNLIRGCRQLSGAMARLRAGLRFSLQYLVSIAILLLAMLGWSIRNYCEFRYFGASDMTGVTLVCGLMVSGTFDADSLAGTGQYDQYIIRKHQQGYYYSGFFLRHDLFALMTDNGRHQKRDALTQTDRSLRAIAADSRKISPWQVNAVGLLRSMWWAVAWPDVLAYSQDGIRLDYVTFENISGTRRGAPSLTQKQMRKGFVPIVSIHLVYDEVKRNWIFSAFSHFAELYYNGWYVVLSLLALVCGIYVMHRGEIALGAPIYAFIANILVNVYLLNVFSRYIHILDALLVFQIALGISVMLARRGGKQAIQSN